MYQPFLLLFFFLFFSEAGSLGVTFLALDLLLDLRLRIGPIEKFNHSIIVRPFENLFT